MTDRYFNFNRIDAADVVENLCAIGAQKSSDLIDARIFPTGEPKLNCFPQLDQPSKSWRLLQAVVQLW